MKEDPVAPLIDPSASVIVSADLKIEAQPSAGTEVAEPFGGYIDENPDGDGIDQRGFTKVNNILAQLENLSELESNW
jgi:hypothetical protein